MRCHPASARPLPLSTTETIGAPPQGVRRAVQQGTPATSQPSAVRAARMVQCPPGFRANRKAGGVRRQVRRAHPAARYDRQDGARRSARREVPARPLVDPLESGSRRGSPRKRRHPRIAAQEPRPRGSQGICRSSLPAPCRNRSAGTDHRRSKRRECACQHLVSTRPPLRPVRDRGSHSQRHESPPNACRGRVARG